MLAKRSVEIETRFLNLTSLSIIRKVVANVKNTAPIRSELFKFIREVGVPYCIAIDFTIDLKLDSALDPDRHKLVRTLLISHIILSRGRGFELLRGNFLILAEGAHYETLKKFEDMPVRVLEILQTKNDMVNGFIAELKQDPVRFNRLLYFKVVDVAAPMDRFQDEAAEFMNNVEERIKQQVFLKDRPQAEVLKSVTAAAKVVYRFNDLDCLSDGAERKVSDEPDSATLSAGEIFVLGSWIGGNNVEVTQKLSDTVQKLLGDDRFDQGAGVTIVLGDGCSIDGSVAASIAQLLIKELKQHKNCRIRVAEKNRRILENSKGFAMIRQNVSYMGTGGGG